MWKIHWMGLYTRGEMVSKLKKNMKRTISKRSTDKNENKK